jgi:cob(I)alamin adenosyltransferase
VKIYTGTGDEGDTGLLGGPRVRKTSPRTEAIGTVDELNAALGLVATEELSPGTAELLMRIQGELFEMGAELASTDPLRHGTRTLGEAQIMALEQAIDAGQGELPPLRQFILPGGIRAAALLHAARSICRRAERRVIALMDGSPEPISPLLIIYLNRLGDLLFVLARQANFRARRGDVLWEKPVR